ncbi:zinc dependent phospholipase C family protein [Cohnella cellulosilytica]|uniref:Zinc dependent phospholipase C family protein n=1 Tax=Cohnella cellulosilytica TaxID=986710 RepID=A0ABW2FCH6_9BACL
MPNVWAHLQFGREVLSAIQADSPMGSPPWKTAFQLGCQGPDFLFYDRYLPWQTGDTDLNKLGALMHVQHCGPFLLSLLEEARTRSAEDPAAAYCLGFLLHHLLDRHLHPFVFSRSGFRKWDHQFYETAMDAEIMMRRAGVSTARTPVAPEIETGGRLPGGFAADFLRIARLHYPMPAERISPGQLDRAVAQMQQAQRLFFDPSGWKGRLVFGQLQPFSPPRRRLAWDVLNDARKGWIDPSDRTVVHCDSAMELWERALTDGRETTAAALRWLGRGPDDEEAARLKASFAGLLGNISYETGKSCGSAAIVYADSVIPG